MVCPPRCRAGGRSRSSSIWSARCRAPQAAYLHRCLAGSLFPRSLGTGATWPFTPWGLHGRSCCQQRRCALTAPFHPLPRTLPGRDCSLLHMPSPIPSAAHRAPAVNEAFPLGSTVPCGVRTFLTAALPEQECLSSEPTERCPGSHLRALHHEGAKKVPIRPPAPCSRSRALLLSRTPGWA